MEFRLSEAQGLVRLSVADTVDDEIAPVVDVRGDAFGRPSGVRPEGLQGSEAMARDRIVEDVRGNRERYARRFGFDLDAICRDLTEGGRGGNT